MIQARILADSQNPKGIRLTTFELRYPRFIHSEFMTHRVFSRNAGSSRAIRPERIALSVMEFPAIPVYWGAEEKGMKARSEVADIEACKAWWLRARDSAVALHKEGIALGLHKQIVNRILEPFQLITVILTATDLDNWFWLRLHKDAQPEIRVLAKAMLEALQASTPKRLKVGDWHMPLLMSDDPFESVAAQLGLTVLETMKRVAVGRCARVSYLTHDGKRDLIKDVELHDTLSQDHHYSPFEHIAEAMSDQRRYANFRGFRQYRGGIEQRPPRLAC